MDIRLTSQDYWAGAGIAAILSAILGIPLVIAYRNEAFKASAVTIAFASALFWGVLATAAIYGFWQVYYQYIFPQWTRWLAPLDALVYSTIGLGLWWIAIHLPGPSVAWFLILGGLESLLEHIFGIYGLGILDKVPILRGVVPFPALTFAFFEYIVYWSLVAWLSIASLKVYTYLKGG